jgi:hypothetical protein
LLYQHSTLTKTIANRVGCLGLSEGQLEGA